MWKCSICGTINSNHEKFCIYCGAESVAKDKKAGKIISTALKFLSIEPDANIYISTTEGELIKKEKIRPVRVLRLITKIGFPAILLLIIFMGIASGIANQNGDGLAMDMKFETIKNNIISQPANKWESITDKYEKINSYFGDNRRFIDLEKIMRDKTEFLGNGISGFGASLRVRTRIFDQKVSDLGKTMGQKFSFLPKLWGYVSEIPEKCGYYFEKITGTINKIIGG